MPREGRPIKDPHDWRQVNVRMKPQQMDMLDGLVDHMNLQPRHAHEYVTRAQLVRKWVREGMLRDMAQEDFQP